MPESQGREDQGHVKALNLDELLRHLSTSRAGELEDVLRDALERPDVKLPTKATVAFLAKYDYGDAIWTDFRIQSPCHATGQQQRCAPCTALEASLKGESAPLTMVVDGSVEVSSVISTSDVNEPRRFAPLRVLLPGEVFGIFEALDRYTSSPTSVQTPWHIVAGSNSIQILAPLDDQRFEDALTGSLSTARLPVRGEALPLRKPRQHWKVVRKVVQYLRISDPTFRPPVTEILLLAPAITAALLKDRDALLHLFGLGWDQTGYMRLETIEDAVLRSRLLRRKAWKQRDAPFLYASVSHVLATRAGRVPGMTPLRPTDAREDVALLGVQNQIRAWLSPTGHRHLPRIIRFRHLGSDHPVAYYSLRHSPLPTPTPWDVDSRKAPKSWQQVAQLFMGMAEALEIAEGLDPIASGLIIKRSEGRASSSHSTHVDRTWRLIGQDFNIPGETGGAVPNLYPSCEYWSAGVRVSAVRDS